MEVDATEAGTTEADINAEIEGHEAVFCLLEGQVTQGGVGS